ncbi:MAG TPA: dienelactone hydrolase family protein [bacterium]|nr:dienelactone hydrolase family protein [bacterium]
MRSEIVTNARVDRRRFLEYLIAGALTAVRPPRAWAAAAKTPPPPGSPPDKVDTSGVTVKPDDPAISAGAIEFPGLVSTLQGYLATPVGGETYPAILLLHDADGLSEHARDVARRFAKIGYVTLAPDLLSRSGGTAKAGTLAQIADAMTRILIPQFLQDGNSAVRYLETHPLVAKTRVGMMSFGLGGAFSWFLLADNSDLRAAAIYYGGVPNLQLVPHMNTSVLAIYGDGDGHDPADLKDLDAAMNKSGLAWTYKVEPKAGRGFFDDTRRGYTPEAAKDAWKMSLDWYHSRLTA